MSGLAQHTVVLPRETGYETRYRLSKRLAFLIIPNRRCPILFIPRGHRWSGRGALFGWTKISGFDRLLTSVRIPHAAKPLSSLFHPPIELACSRPRRRLHFDRPVNFPAICLVALAVLIESHIEIRRLLLRIVLGEVGSAPAHHAGVEDPPDTRADVHPVVQ